MSHTQYGYTYIHGCINYINIPYLLNFSYAIFEMKVFLTILLNNQRRCNFVQIVCMHTLLCVCVCVQYTTSSRTAEFLLYNNYCSSTSQSTLSPPHPPLIIEAPLLIKNHTFPPPHLPMHLTTTLTLIRTPLFLCQVIEHHGYREVLLLILDLVASGGDGVSQVQTGQDMAFLSSHSGNQGEEGGRGGGDGNSINTPST